MLGSAQPARLCAGASRAAIGALANHRKDTTKGGLSRAGKRRARSARPTRAIRCAAEPAPGRQRRSGINPHSNQRLKNQKADDGGLDEKENCVELMTALVSRHRGSHQACEIKPPLIKYVAPKATKCGTPFSSESTATRIWHRHSYHMDWECSLPLLSASRFDGY